MNAAGGRFPEPEHFRVVEIPLYPPAGEGGHTFLRVEKRDQTTEAVARALARAAGVAPRDVGYAGRKDRHAVSEQWFSVPGLPPDSARALALPGARVLEAAAHPHKLRTGQLRGNRFELFVHGVSREAADRAQRRLETLVASGLPNRFGAQRFGAAGDNARVGAQLLAGRTRVRDRRQARFLISALQAQVFNAVLAGRPAPLDGVEPGDVAFVHASGGRFLVEDASAEAPRAAAFEISATGPLFGTRVLEPGGAVAERERGVLAAHGLAEGEWSAPRGIRLRGSRRPLRVRPEASAIAWAGGVLHLAFELPAGSYATVLLDELLGPEGG